MEHSYYSASIAPRPRASGGLFSMPEPEENEQLLREQIRGAHADRSRARRKTARKRELTSEPVGQEARTYANARVLRSEGAFFVVRLADRHEVRAKSYKGTRSGNPKSTLVAVGDEVKVAPHEQGYLIEEVLPRRTKLSRRAAGRKTAFEQVIVANIDMLVIVASVHEPKLRSGIIDRYIVAGVDGGLTIAIVINKLDLASAEELDEALYFRDLYREIGYPVHLISASEGEGDFADQRSNRGDDERVCRAFRRWQEFYRQCHSRPRSGADGRASKKIPARGAHHLGQHPSRSDSSAGVSREKRRGTGTHVHRGFAWGTRICKFRNRSWEPEIRVRGIPEIPGAMRDSQLFAHSRAGLSSSASGGRGQNFHRPLYELSKAAGRSPRSRN